MFPSCRGTGGCFVHYLDEETSACRCPLVQYIKGLSNYIIILEILIVLAYYGCDDASTAVACCSLSVLFHDEVTSINTVCPPAWLGLENKQEA